MTEQRAQYITGDDGLTWHPIQVRLGDLDGWDGNPKTLTKTAAARLLKSTQRLGQLQTIAVSPAKPDGRRDIYDGHQRDAVWSKGYHPDIVVWALESSRPLTDKERRDVVMLTMTARGSFDWDALSGWADLGEYFEAVDLGEWKRDVAALGNFLGSEGIITDGEAFGALPNEDRAPFQQMTFTLHDTQAEQVREALKAARSMGDFTDSPNENSNGNALARICEVFLTEHGDC